MQKLNLYLAVVAMTAMGLFAESSFAVVDTTAITTAQSDLLTYVAAILALAVAVWSALRAVGLFGKR